MAVLTCFDMLDCAKDLFALKEGMQHLGMIQDHKDAGCDQSVV